MARGKANKLTKAERETAKVTADLGILAGGSSHDTCFEGHELDFEFTCDQ